MSNPVTAALIGAGQRGLHEYGPYALANPADLRFVAVAEPDEGRRRRFAAEHGIAPERAFADWRDLAGSGRLADMCLNATQDRDHHDSSLALVDAGYDLLLEKPIATRPGESAGVVRAAEARGVLLEVCHVLRYTPFFSSVHGLLAGGAVGDVIHVEHRENVAFRHMAHSYVRGAWAVEASSSPMLLAKCCHDLDLILWNMGRPVTRVHSFGSLTHFRPERAPAGAPDRCVEGCPAAPECLYDARAIYLGEDSFGLPRSALTDDPTRENLARALREGPYGRCVFRAGNDVVDHQTVSFEFEGGATGVLIMQGHSGEEDRTLRYDGTRGTLVGRFTHEGGSIEVTEHGSGKRTRVDTKPERDRHGGGDFGLLRAFVRAVRERSRLRERGREALESHLLAHAAERSRREGVVVTMSEVRRAVG